MGSAIRTNMAILIVGFGLMIAALGSVWTEWDYKIIDRFYRRAVASGYGSASSSDVVYLLITDDSYRYFKNNTSV